MRGRQNQFFHAVEKGTGFDMKVKSKKSFPVCPAKQAGSIFIQSLVFDFCFRIQAREFPCCDHKARPEYVHTHRNDLQEKRSLDKLARQAQPAHNNNTPSTHTEGEQNRAYSNLLYARMYAYERMDVWRLSPCLIVSFVLSLSEFQVVKVTTRA